MTIMTPIEGITAPAHPAIPTETFQAYDETPLLSSRRADGWSAANQRLFLECIAEGHGVEAATYRVGLSAASAYAFRRTAKGAAFALGWRAASLVARDAIAETLLVRALEGQVTTFTRANGDVVTRHHHDNGLCMRLLARLDRQVESAPDADTKAARLVAQEFDAFLDLVSKDEGPARAGLFLARRCGGLGVGLGTEGHADDATTGDFAPIYALAAADRLVRTGVATAQDVAVADLDPTDRANWTADQWQRADAAGLVALAVPADEPEKSAPASQHSQHSRPEPDPVWWDEETEDWRTSFPPSADFTPDHEDGEPGDHDYQRSLSEEEAALMGDDPDRYTGVELAALVDARDRYFAELATAATAADPDFLLTQVNDPQNPGTPTAQSRSQSACDIPEDEQ